MNRISLVIEEIANLVAHRFYLSCFRDRRKKNDLRGRMIDEIKVQELELIHAHEEALRIELAQEISATRGLTPLARVALYSDGPRSMVALAIVDIAQ